MNSVSFKTNTEIQYLVFGWYETESLFELIGVGYKHQILMTKYSDSDLFLITPIQFPPKLKAQYCW